MPRYCYAVFASTLNTNLIRFPTRLGSSSVFQPLHMVMLTWSQRRCSEHGISFSSQLPALVDTSDLLNPCKLPNTSLMPSRITKKYETQLPPRERIPPKRLTPCHGKSISDCSFSSLIVGSFQASSLPSLVVSLVVQHIRSCSLCSRSKVH